MKTRVLSDAKSGFKTTGGSNAGMAYAARQNALQGIAGFALRQKFIPVLTTQIGELNRSNFHN